MCPFFLRRTSRRGKFLHLSHGSGSILSCERKPGSSMGGDSDKCVLMEGPFRGHIVNHNDAQLRSDHRTPNQDLQQQQSPKVPVTAMEEQHGHVIGEKSNRADCERLAFQLSQKAPAQEIKEGEWGAQCPWNWQMGRRSENRVEKHGDKSKRATQNREAQPQQRPAAMPTV